MIYNNVSRETYKKNETIQTDTTDTDGQRKDGRNNSGKATPTHSPLPPSLAYDADGVAVHAVNNKGVGGIEEELISAVPPLTSFFAKRVVVYVWFPHLYSRLFLLCTLFVYTGCKSIRVK